MLLLFWNNSGGAVTGDTYYVCSTTDPDTISIYVDGDKIVDITSA